MPNDCHSEFTKAFFRPVVIDVGIFMTLPTERLMAAKFKWASRNLGMGNDVDNQDPGIKDVMLTSVLELGPATLKITVLYFHDKTMLRVIWLQ